MHTKELMKKSVLVIIIRIVGASIAFVMTVFFARLLGSADFGVFSIGATIFMIIGILSRFGLENVVLKRVSEHVETNPALAVGYLKSSVYIVTIIGLFISGILFVLSDFISNIVFEIPSLSSVLPIFAIAVVPTSIVLLIAAALKSLSHPVIATFLQSLLVPLLIIVCAYMFWITHSATLNTLTLTYALGACIATLFGYYIWRKKSPETYISKVHWKNMLNQGWPMLFISSGGLILSSSDVIILGLYTNPMDVGIYAVASKTALITTLILVGINSMTAPKYAKLYAEKKLDDIALLSQTSSLILLILVVPPSIFLLSFPEWVMSLFGKEFIIGSSILMILTYSQLLNVSVGSVGYLLTMTGKEKILMKIMFITAFFNIFFSIISVQFFGVTGVAITTAFSISLWNIWAMIEVKKHLGFWMLSPAIFQKNKLIDKYL